MERGYGSALRYQLFTMAAYGRGMGWLLYHAPAFTVAVLLVVAERRLGSRPDDWRINLCAWALNLIAAATIYDLVSRWEGISLIDADRLPWWLAALLFVLVNDLGEYLFHRMQHRIPLLWSMHSLHHSDPDMGALTTMRHFWADPLFKTITVWSAAALVINPTLPALIAYFAISLWNFVTHSRLPLDFGRASWILNAPAYHRRHHSSDPAHFDSNFAALFPIWDVIAGSYYRSSGQITTGLDTRPTRFEHILAWPVHYRRNERLAHAAPSAPSAPASAPESAA